MEILLLLYSSLILAILIHEIGHLLAVAYANHKVVEFSVGPVSVKNSDAGYSIKPRASLFTGVVAYKRTHGTATWGNEILIISAGVIANIITGTALVTYYHLASSNGIIAILGWASILLGLLNLLPMHSKELRLDSDAKRFFSILEFKKSISQAKKYDLGEPNVRVKFQPSREKNSEHVQIELLNDSTTPMDFVVDTIKTFLNFNEFSAVLLMLSIHNDGDAKLGWLDIDAARKLSDQINNEARTRGFPFQCRVLTT
jgi:ATP-dependent Clp protease adapter protein ClpS